MSNPSEATGQVSIADAIRHAIQHHQQGHHADAERVYRAVLEAAPDHFDALHLLGVLCAQTGHPGEGASYLARAVGVQPQAADAQANLANVLKSLGRYDDALVHCEKALAVKAGNAGILNIRAGILLDAKRFEAALGACDAVITADPAMAEAHYHRGVALQALGRMADSVASYDRAIALLPEFASAHSNRGNALRALGRFDEALASAEAATKAAPNYALAWNNRAAILRALGRNAEALESADRALALRNDLVEAHANRGGALKDLERYEEALRSLDRALALAPEHLEAHLNRAFALVGLGRPDEGLAIFDHVLASYPERVEALHGRATALHRAKRYDEALSAYDRVLERYPDLVPSLNGRAGVLREQNKFAEALAAWDRVVALDPNLPEVHHNRGSAHYELGHYEEAIACYDRALALKPDYVQALHNRAAALSPLMRYEEALATCDRLLAINPDHADGHHNRGSALSSLNRFGEALDAYGRALALKHDFVASLQNRASVLAYLTRHDEAARDFAHVLAIDPDYPYVHGALFSSRLHCCDWHDYDATLARLTSDAEAGKRVSDPFPFVITTASAAAQLACAQTFARDKFPLSAAPLWSGERYEHSKIRIAYLSGDFHEHATSYLMAGLFERHDRARFETYAISFGPATPNAMRERLEAAFDRFIDARAQTDLQIAQLLRELEVDIAVDLKGYTFDSRPGILALRPAPVQVNYLGYPGTIGADWLDYLIADEVVVPASEHRNYAERVVTMPDSYQPNDDTRAIAAETPSRADEGLPASGFVFCSFNNSYKVTPHVFDVWMRLLTQVPGSVLWLLEGNSLAPPNLRREAAARGVAPERLIFAPRRDLPLHLARHRLADLFLDTLPVNAHTTASDALWAGLPIVTCLGTTFAGRVAGSLLRAAGMSELATASLADYESLALALATDPVRLAALRTKLAASLPTCALFATDRFRRHLEAAYAAMCERQRAGEPPTAFAVPRQD